jgi:hypothetical protein
MPDPVKPLTGDDEIVTRTLTFTRGAEPVDDIAAALDSADMVTVRGLKGDRKLVIPSEALWRRIMSLLRVSVPV